VARAVKLGLATEAELGRLEGGEAGIATAADSQLTDPDVAERFIEETGVQILAPCMCACCRRPVATLTFYIAATGTAAMCRPPISSESFSSG
jgi:hypothetical protein